MEQISLRVNTDSAMRFKIMRRSVWVGASRAMGRSNFVPEKKVDVKFTDNYGTSEGAMDNRSTREFFCVCVKLRTELASLRVQLMPKSSRATPKVLTTILFLIKDFV